MMLHPAVSIIIVNWNGKADTLACLESLRADSYPAKRVIVVDNGSSDDSVSTLRGRFPEVTVLETGRNLGFTGGNNAGIRAALGAGAEYVYLLNNDTICEPGALSELVRTAEGDRSIGIVTPVIHYFDHPNELWFAGSRIDLPWGVAVHDNTRRPSRDAAPYPVPWVSGCAMLIPRHLIAKLNGFDDRYFLIWEDVDLSLRARAAGARVVVAPAARIYHKVSRSVGTSSANGCYYHVRNNLLLLRTVLKRGYARAAARVVLTRLREAIREIVMKPHRPDRLFATMTAVRDHLMRRYGGRVIYRAETVRRIS